MPGEFNVIRRFFEEPFTEHFSNNENVDLGIGDDCALLNLCGTDQLATSVDTLVAGVHFLESAPADKIAQRALRVNLSDLAAMGAEPIGFTLALTLPEENEAWLQAFSSGLLSCAKEFDIPLVGGDTTRGPLSITVQVMGKVPVGKALIRSGAKVGDTVYVSGALGAAAAALPLLEETSLTSDESELLDQYYQPHPALKLGIALRGIATAAIDISDGLLADLGHICQRSNVAAEIDWQRIPLLNALKNCSDKAAIQKCALAGGDDYQLCFTAPEGLNSEVEGFNIFPVGKIMSKVPEDKANAVTVIESGIPLQFSEAGYRHF